MNAHLPKVSDVLLYRAGFIPEDQDASVSAEEEEWITVECIAVEGGRPVVKCPDGARSTPLQPHQWKFPD